MKRTFGLTIVATLLAMSTAMPSRSDASITYNFVDYPEYQDGYRLSGTITTDGTLGALSSANFVSWSLLVSNGANSYTISSADTELIALNNRVEATATSIVLPTENIADFEVNTLVLYGANFSRVQWDTLNPIGPFNAGYFAKYTNGNAVLWESYPNITGPGWTIATVASVPEPSSLISLAIAGVALGAARYRFNAIIACDSNARFRYADN